MFINHLNFFFWGIPWWSNGSDFTFSLPGAWVQSLVEELRSHKPHDMAKKILFLKVSCSYDVPVFLMGYLIFFFYKSPL